MVNYSAVLACLFPMLFLGSLLPTSGSILNLTPPRDQVKKWSIYPSACPLPALHPEPSACSSLWMVCPLLILDPNLLLTRWYLQFYHSFPFNQFLTFSQIICYHLIMCQYLPSLLSHSTLPFLPKTALIGSTSQKICRKSHLVIISTFSFSTFSLACFI